MANKKDDIIQLLLLNRGAMQRFNVQRIGLFGSFKMGTNNSESDIDLLVEFEEGKKHLKIIQGSAFC